MKKENLIKRPRKIIAENFSFVIVLVGTFLALLLLVGLMFGSFYQSARNDAVVIGNMTVEQEAKRIEEALYFGFNTLQVSSNTVDNMLQEGATVAEVEEYMVKETRGIISGINPDFSGIYGVIRDEYVDGIGWQPESGYDPYARPWYLAAAEKQGELAIVSPYVDAQTNRIMLSFSKILGDGKSAVSLDIQLDNIYEVTKTVQLDGKGFCFLMDKKGQIIAHRDGSQVGKNYLRDPEFAAPEFQSLMEQINLSADSDMFPNVDIDGDNCMVFTHDVQNEWSVVLVVRSTDLFETLNESLVRSIIVSLLIFFMVGYFCTSNYRNKRRALQYAEDIRIDDLTGINNRGEFDRYLRTAMDDVNNEKDLYLLLFDVDDFKRINDEFGHQEGDRALRLIAKAFMEKCHETDWFCARYGGDEFVIICKCNDEAVVKEIKPDLQKIINTLVSESNLPYSLSVSSGWTCYDPSMHSLADLVDAADEKLYKMKAGRKRYEQK